MRRLPALATLGLSYLIGSVPVTNLVSRALQGIDLRDVDNGTVSGTNLYKVTGFGPLAAAGILELAKGAAGPALAGPGRRGLAAASAGAAIAGHDWSPFLGYAGGRGLSVAMGSLLVSAPEGAALIAGGMAAGRIAGETGLASLLSVAALPPLLARTRGRRGALLAGAVAVPIVAKRLAGNGPPRGPLLRTYASRLLFDRDGSSAEAGRRRHRPPVRRLVASLDG